MAISPIRTGREVENRVKLANPIYVRLCRCLSYTFAVVLMRYPQTRPSHTDMQAQH